MIVDVKLSLLFSTHITSELDNLADFIEVIDDGRTMAPGLTDELHERFAVAPVAGRLPKPSLPASSVTSLGVGTPFVNDERERLDIRSVTFPISRTTVVVGRYIEMVVWFIAAALVGTVTAVLTTIVRGGIFEVGTYLLFRLRDNRRPGSTAAHLLRVRRRRGAHFWSACCGVGFRVASGDARSGWCHAIARQTGRSS